jgi:hypothetical protein
MGSAPNDRRQQSNVVMAKHNPSPRKRLLRGVTKDAKRLGCDPSHLSRCLRGIRQSRSLMKRYWELKAEKVGSDGNI